MTDPLAFRGTYADWKLIKTRGVVQVVMEVPLADANAAYNVLGGMPDSSREVWFAIAPLKLPPEEKETNKSAARNPATPQPKDKPAGAKRPESASSHSRMEWRELQPAAQSAIRCADEVFRKFLREEHGLNAHNPDEAASTIRAWCNIKSRSELSTNHKARVLWHSLDEQFQTWKIAERVGA